MGGVGGVDAILDVAFFEKRLGDGDDHGVGCEVRHLFFFSGFFFLGVSSQWGSRWGRMCVVVFFSWGTDFFLFGRDSSVR